MTYTFTEKKRIRKSFSKRKKSVMEIPYLLETQLESYHKYLQAETPAEQRVDQGLQAAFKSIFPIEAHNGSSMLEFVSYRLETPPFDVREK